LPAKIIDIGEWKKAHGMVVTAPQAEVPAARPPADTPADVFVNRFLSPEV
jgi:hypothetical protein